MTSDRNTTNAAPDIDGTLRAIGADVAARLVAAGLTHEVEQASREFARVSLALRRTTATAPTSAADSPDDRALAATFVREQAQKEAAIIERNALNLQQAMDLSMGDRWRGAVARAVYNRRQLARSQP